MGNTAPSEKEYMNFISLIGTKTVDKMEIGEIVNYP